MKDPSAVPPKLDCLGMDKRRGATCEGFRTPSSSVQINTIQMIFLLPVFGGITVAFFCKVLGHDANAAETTDEEAAANDDDFKPEGGDKAEISGQSAMLGASYFLLIGHLLAAFFGRKNISSYQYKVCFGDFLKGPLEE